MFKKLSICVFFTIIALSLNTFSQQPVYPIIFVHGLDSKDLTWQGTINTMSNSFGWSNPYSNNGIFHAVLNATFNNTNYLMDVKTDFANWHNDLSSNDIYAINFKNRYDWITDNIFLHENHGQSGESESNESAIVKQGYTLGLMIQEVLQKTGAEKVILVGHSMGGLAIREYLQRRLDNSTIPKWWVDPADLISGHKVAKVATIGTPHLGSNLGNIVAIPNLSSEAVRDLRYHYLPIGGPPNPNTDIGVYLYGGSEALAALGDFHNADVNADGDEQDLDVLGINSRYVSGDYNPLLPLPANINYTWITSDNGGFGNGDGVVRRDRQWLYTIGDTLLTDRFHLNETSDIKSIIRGLDEPDEFDLSYSIQIGNIYHAFATYQTNLGNFDTDIFKFAPNASGVLRFRVSNIPLFEQFTNMEVKLYASDQTTLLGTYENTGGVDQIEFYRDDLVNTDYYLHIRTIIPPSGSDSWLHPYQMQIEQIGPPAQIFTYAVPPSIEANNTSRATLYAQILDTYGNLAGTATNPVTFTIISGGGSGQLIGPTTVDASGGIANIQLQSTLLPGAVEIEMSSPGLTGNTVTVYTYDNTTVTFVSGAISSNTTWTLAGSPYEVIGDITVNSGVVLTIEPGVLVRFRQAMDLFVSGGLNANGTSFNPIIFTSAGAQLPGTWGGIKFSATTISESSILSYCQFDFAGSSSYGENPYPIYLDLQANPAIANTTIDNCRINGIGLVTGNYGTDVTLQNYDLPFWVGGDIRLQQGATLTVEAGVLIKMAQDTDFFIDGGLSINGAASNPVVFTSYKDDSRGGDTNGDGSSTPLPSDWGGIKFSATALSVASNMDYCELYYGGSSSYGENPYPIYLDLQANPAIANTSIDNCRINGIGLVTGNYGADVTLQNYDLPFWVGGDIRLQQGATLTVEAGVLIKMAQDTDFFIDGGLSVNGAVSNPVVFTSYKDDSRGGDTNGDGSSTPLPSDWGGIKFSSTALSAASNMDYCELYYGGSSSYGENPYPIYLDLQANPAIANTSIDNCRINGIGLVTGNYGADVTLQNYDLPFWVGGDIRLQQGATLTVEAGVLIKMAQDTDFFIDGGLSVNGADNAQVIFTSYRDDSRGGDTNGNGSSLPLPGDWGGIKFRVGSLSTSIINNCLLYYAGSNSYGENPYPIICENANPHIQNIVIDSSLSHGIYLTGLASPDLGGGSQAGLGGNQFLGFVGNANKYAVYNNGTAEVLAKFNYWETTDSTVIANNIYDFYDNSSKGRVVFMPFALPGQNLPPAMPTILSPNSGVEVRPGDYLTWTESLDPNPTDQVFYHIQIDDSITFNSPEIDYTDTFIEALTKEDVKKLNAGFPNTKLKENGAKFTNLNSPEDNSISVQLDLLTGFNNLQDDLDYYWRVRAIDNFGAASGFTDSSRYFFFNKVNTPPFPPTAGFSPANGDTVIDLTPEISWFAAADPDLSDHAGNLHYVFQLDEDNNFTIYNYEYTSPPGQSSLFVPDTLTDDHYWYYRIKTVDDEGAESSWSNVQIFYTYHPEAPLAFNLISPANQDTLDSTLVTFQWENAVDPDSNDVVRYRLMYSYGLPFDSLNAIIVDSLLSTSSTINFPGDSTVSWQVEAFDRFGLLTGSIQSDWYFIIRVNNAPQIINPIADTTLAEDAPNALLASNLNNIFIDLDGDPLTFSVTTADTNLNAWIVSDTSLWVKPAANYFGQTSLQVTADDGNGGITWQIVTITVYPVNDPPVLSNIPPIIFPEDSSYRFDLDAYVTDVDHDTTEISWSAGFPANTLAKLGSQIKLKLNHRQKIESTLTRKFENTGTTPGELRIIRRKSKTSSSILRKTKPLTKYFAPVSTNPSKRPDTKTFSKVGITYGNNDSLMIQIDSLTHIAVITATPNFYGLDIPVMFTAVDDSGASDSDTTAISVQPVNDPPVISPLPELSFNEDDTLTYVISNWFPFVDDPDTPDGELSYLVTGGNNVIVQPGNAVYFFYALPNWFGRDTLQLVVSDSVLADTADLFVNVNPLNDPPAINNLPDSLVFEADSSATLNIWDYVEDIETPDSLLDYQFTSSNDSLIRDYNSTTGILTLSSAVGFSGNVILHVIVTDDSSAGAEDSMQVIVSPVTGIGGPVAGIPQQYILMQNYPNPFNPLTHIRYGLPKTSEVKLEIYNMLGQKVTTLVSGPKTAGYHVVDFDARYLASGLYFYRLQADRFTMARKMLLMK